MFSFKLLFAAAALLSVSARHIVFEDQNRFYFIPIDGIEDMKADSELIPARIGRPRRQVHGSVTANIDGTSAANVRVPIAGNDKNILSAIGGLDFNKNHQLTQQSAGLSLENINGHGLALTHSKMPGVADRVVAAGHVNLFDNGNHKVDANAFAARTMPAAPQFPNFNTYGGGADYMYKDKIGAGVNMARTPLFDKTDYSATGKLNIFRSPDSSLDFNAGLSKSVSPFLPKSSWEPNYGFSFKKWF